MNRATFLNACAGMLGMSVVRCASPTEPIGAGHESGRSCVAIVDAASYADVYVSMERAFSLLSGIPEYVRGQTVTVKVNLTGWGQDLFGLSAMDTYVVHSDTAEALVRLLFEFGARRVRFIESAPASDGLRSFALRLGWNIRSIESAGPVEFVNTRNGGGQPYVVLRVSGGRLFDEVYVHEAYATTGPFVSLAKLKNHRTTGVTLSLKNLFGMPPNSLYATDAPSEDALGIRMHIHDRRGVDAPLLPGERAVLQDQPPEVRVPTATIDFCNARPIGLSVIEGVSTIAGGEGPWHEATGELSLVRPQLLIAGRDPVATDVVATAVMGYPDPLSETARPFVGRVNHLKLAHDAGIGNGRLSTIDVLGLTLLEALRPFPWP